MVSRKRPAASGVPKTITAVEGWDHVAGTVAFSVPLDLSALLALRHTRTNQPIRVLDLGCGDGRIAAELHHLGFAVVGYDASPQLIARG